MMVILDKNNERDMIEQSSQNNQTTVEPNADLRIEVDRLEGNTGSTSRTGWLDRFEEWINFLKDVVKILVE